MIHLSIQSHNNPFITNIPNFHKHIKTQSLKTTITCSHKNNPRRNFIEKQQPTFMVETETDIHHHQFVVKDKKKKKKEDEKEKIVFYEKEKKKKGLQIGTKQMLILCGFGYWLQGFRCFPWLGLNFHMASNLNLHPSMLQLVQYSANLPMVAKPLYGILSDVIYVGGAHRIPYIITGGKLIPMAFMMCLCLLLFYFVNVSNTQIVCVIVCVWFYDSEN